MRALLTSIILETEDGKAGMDEAMDVQRVFNI